MTNLSSKAKKLARRLRVENRTKSWRTIASQYPPVIKHMTLNRIARSLKREGEQWYPKNKEIQLALGLIKPRKPRKPSKRIEDMTADELINMRDRLSRKIEHVEYALDQIVH